MPAERRPIARHRSSAKLTIREGKSMSSNHLLDELYRYNDWANRKIFDLCVDLPEEALDQSRELGLGSLRKVLFHLLSAEQIWFERWTQQPWRPFQIDPEGMSTESIRNALLSLSQQRQALMDQERSRDWSGVIHYMDAKKNSYQNPLKPLLLHVANHGIHHRAQALNYLKSFGRTIRGGIDFLVYKLAYPSVEQKPETVDWLRKHGLEVQVELTQGMSWDSQLIGDYFRYNDWAMQTLYDLTKDLSTEQLHRNFAMGPGSIAKTLSHMIDAELWWQSNWEQPQPWSDSPVDRSFEEIWSAWEEVRQKRNHYLSSIDDQESQRIVFVTDQGPAMGFRILDSLVQLCGHGTHHRAQWVNMLRHSGVTTPSIDYIAWVRARSA